MTMQGAFLQGGSALFRILNDSPHPRLALRAGSAVRSDSLPSQSESLIPASTQISHLSSPQMETHCVIY
jgi:hypothetical protein